MDLYLIFLGVLLIGMVVIGVVNRSRVNSASREFLSTCPNPAKIHERHGGFNPRVDVHIEAADPTAGVRYMEGTDYGLLLRAGTHTVKVKFSTNEVDIVKRTKKWSNFVPMEVTVEPSTEYLMDYRDGAFIFEKYTK